jgi:hypothetical protein
VRAFARAVPRIYLVPCKAFFVYIKFKRDLRGTVDFGSVLDKLQFINSWQARKAGI